MSTSRMKPFIYVILFVLSVSLVVAPAGGGAASGGGGGGVAVSSSAESSSSSSSSSGEGPYFYKLECFDNGQLTFKQKPAIKPVVAENEDGTKLTIAGEWEGTTFTSEEAEINDAGTYTIYDSKNGDRKVECPGLKFSCRLVELNLLEFSREEGKVRVTFTLAEKGTSVDDLLFEFQGQNQVLKYQRGVVVSSKLKGVQILDEGENKYILEIADAPHVSTLKVTYPKCIGKYYVSSKIESGEEPVEEVGIEFQGTISQKKIEQSDAILKKIFSLFRNLF